MKYLKISKITGKFCGNYQEIFCCLQILLLRQREKIACNYEEMDHTVAEILRLGVGEVVVRVGWVGRSEQGKRAGNTRDQLEKNPWRKI